ncbi:rhomboid family intramembrane serine protease [Marinobacterium arenosum]|uniref:rhomboid family intramembrane serine protease n=1 Tax=Marinobacterium arenosum TaxID=2862496 RepID=UPI001C970333|nr:rhomboid family intramembrane serine protease [Marinobacterium arenosum]MBY4677982.1 rhomboid family intramembrane serine protease [Marinobacterium arenosum]
MVKVLEVPLQMDLAEFAAFLWRHQIPHRIVEQPDRQELWVAHDISADRVRGLFELWQQGVDLDRLDLRSRHRQPSSTIGFWRQQPLTLLLILFSCIATLLIGFGDNMEWLRQLTIAELIQQRNELYTTGLAGTFESGQLWRLVTPIFLHFNAPHLLFNMLWVWVVGSRIEQRQGAWVLLGLVLLSGILANLAQYVASGPLFGGMSGVVFALLGYSWLWDRRHPRQQFELPSALMPLMVGWLVLGFTGVLEGMGMGAIANTAHLTGLLVGLAYVPLVGRILKP